MARISSQGSIVFIGDPAAPVIARDIIFASVAMPCVITLSSPGPLPGDIVVPRGTGWASLEGRPFKVNAVDGTSLTLEDSDTSRELATIADDATLEKPGFIEMCRTTMTVNSPAGAVIDTTTLCEEQHQIDSGLPAISTWAANGFYDIEDQALPIVRDFYRNGETAIIDVRMRDGSGYCFSGTVNTYDITEAVNAAVTTNVGGNVDGGICFYNTPPVNAAVLFAAFDPSHASNITAGGAFTQLTDLSGNERHLIAGGVTGPSIGAINSVQAADFFNANHDTMHGLLFRDFGRHVGQMGMDYVIQFRNVTTVWALWQQITSSVGNRFATSFTIAGQPMLSTRRQADDVNFNLISTVQAFLVGIPYWVAQQVNFETRLIQINIDYFREPRAANWTHGNGLTEDLPSSSDPTLGFVPVATFADYILGPFRFWHGWMTDQQLAARRALVQPIYNTPLRRTQIIEAGDTLQNRVYQRTGVGAGITLDQTIKVIVGGNSTVQAQILKRSDDAVVMDWTTFGPTTGTGQTFTIVGQAFPGGATYMKSRKTGDNVPSAYVSTNTISVGDDGAFTGNSDMRNMWSQGSVTDYPISVPTSAANKVPRAFRGYGWYYLTQQTIPTQNEPGTREPVIPQTCIEVYIHAGGLTGGAVNGNGSAALGKQYTANAGVPLGQIQCAVGGTGYYDLLAPGGVLYDELVRVHEASGGPGHAAGAIKFLCIRAGHTEASNDYERVIEDYGNLFDGVQALMTAVTTAMRTYFANPTLPIFYGVIDDLANISDDTKCNDCRRGQMKYIADNAANHIHQLASKRDFPLLDNSHYLGQHYGHCGYRDAACIGFVLGYASNSAVGAKLTGATVAVGTDVVTLNFTHGTLDGSTKFVDGVSGTDAGTAISGFKIRKGTTVLASTVALVAGVPKLTAAGLNAQVGDTIEITNGGSNPIVSNPIRGNVLVPGSLYGAPPQFFDWTAVTIS